jgi:hypothetical protein
MIRQADLASTLDDATRRSFDSARPVVESGDESYLDVACPACAAPARLVYEVWEARPTAWCVSFRAVVELTP